MSDNIDYTAPWYHGSPFEMTILQAGSWVTPFKEVAKAFSHKPETISMSDDFLQVTHDGELPGFLYQIDELIGLDDVTVLPGTMQTHWQTQRDLTVTCIAALPITDPPRFTPDEMENLKKLKTKEGSQHGFFTDNPAADG